MPQNPHAYRDRGESVAKSYLEEKGLRFVVANHATRWGEIDLVFMDAGTVVIVEVKRRSGDRFGGGEEAVDQRKRARLTRAALLFLQERDLLGRSIRFDVVVVDGRGVTHWPHAFEAVGDFYY